jgi:PKD repeat protein
MRAVKILILFLLLILGRFSFAQKEANIWYFGNRTGLDFNTQPLTILYNSKLNSSEGSGSVADSSGNLLFYSDGDTIWNKDHKIMNNGTGLSNKYSGSSPSAALIVRQPLSKRYYYIFNSGERTTSRDVFYSIVDMDGDNGNGKVIVKRRLLVNKSAEKIALVKHANKKDIWVAIKQGVSDTLFIFLLTENGLSSKVLKYNTYQDSFGTGQIKFAPNGKYLAFANSGNITRDTSCYLYTFNTITGGISNQRRIHVRSYCVEFSPNSKYLYSYVPYGKQGFIQYPIKNIKTNFWPDSSCYHINLPFKSGSLQLAPNGKIYGNSFDSFLRVIRSPNLKGAKCNPEVNGQKIVSMDIEPFPYKSSYGLPSFMSSYLRPNSFNISSSCINEPTQFLLLDSIDNDSVKWIFGDTDSKEKNYSSSLKDVSHTYTKYGNYTVSLITNYDNMADTVTEIIYFVNPNPNFEVKDVCDNDTVRFTNISSALAGQLSYKWTFSDGQFSNQKSPNHLYSIADTTRTYNVTLVATMQDGCSDSIVKSVTVNENPLSDFNYTANSNTVEFNAIQKGNTKYIWALGNGDSAIASKKEFTYTYSNVSKKYTVCLKVLNAAGCYTKTCKEVAINVAGINLQKSKSFKILPNPNNGNFSIEMNHASVEISIEVYNAAGKLLAIENNLNINGLKIYVSNLGLASGFYFIKIVNNENSYYEKIIINTN